MKVNEYFDAPSAPGKQPLHMSLGDRDRLPTDVRHVCDFHFSSSPSVPPTPSSLPLSLEPHLRRIPQKNAFSQLGSRGDPIITAALICHPTRPNAACTVFMLEVLRSLGKR